MVFRFRDEIAFRVGDITGHQIARIIAKGKETRFTHATRIEDTVLYVQIPGLLGHRFDDQSEDDIIQVGIAEFTLFSPALRSVRIHAHYFHRCAGFDIGFIVFNGNAGGVQQTIGDGDIVFVLHRYTGQDGTYGLVEGELTFLDQLHHHNGSEHLGHGSDAELAARVDGGTAFVVGFPYRFFQHFDAVVCHEDDPVETVLHSFLINNRCNVGDARLGKSNSQKQEETGKYGDLFHAATSVSAKLYDTACLNYLILFQVCSSCDVHLICYPAECVPCVCRE